MAEVKYNKFPERLRELRGRRGVSQKSLSELFGLSKNMVCRYETGQAHPKTETLIRIADYFGVSLDYLTGISEKNSRAEHYSVPRSKKSMR